MPNNIRSIASISSLVDDKYSIMVFTQPGGKLSDMRDVKNLAGNSDIQLELQPVANGIYTVVFPNNKDKLLWRVIVSN